MSESKELQYNDDWQTKSRGTNEQEYEIYTAFTDDNPVKTYDEWLNS